MPDFEILHGDNRTLLPTFPDASFDAIVTDPPYEWGMGGKKWDRSGIAFDVGLWQEALRVLKPGGHLLAFGGPRTYHRLACAIEDAGFDILNMVVWMFSQGFPKGQNLKPCQEPIALARKPLEKGLTIAANILKHGTGGLNIDACRVPLAGDYKSKPNGRPSMTGLADHYDPATANQPDDKGRWPGNLAHDGSDEVAALFPFSKGSQSRIKGTEPSEGFGGATYGGGPKKRIAQPESFRGDLGSAARFFYCAKATRADRNEGLDNKRIVSIELAEPNSKWEQEDQKVKLLVDTGVSPPRVIGVCGSPRRSVCDWNTMLFGRNSTADLFRQVSTCITSTKTVLTTPSEIYSCFLGWITCANIPAANGETACSLNPAETAEIGSLLIVTTKEDATEFLPGVENAASKMQLKISVSGAYFEKHPTVKPESLMRWLVRMVTPPGGRVLDLFCGSGSTGKAALLEGFDFTGVEMDEHYAGIARCRCNHAKTEKK